MRFCLLLIVFFAISCSFDENQDSIKNDINANLYKKGFNNAQLTLMDIQGDVQTQLDDFCLDNADSPLGSISSRRCWHVLSANTNSYSWFGNLDTEVYSLITNSGCNNGSYVSDPSDDMFYFSTYFIDNTPHEHLNYNMSYDQVNDMIIDFQTKLSLTKSLVADYYSDYDNVEIYINNIDIHSDVILCCPVRYLYFNFNLYVKAYND